MNFVNKIFLILILLCGISFAQNLNDQFKIAEDLFYKKDFFNAITEYKRLIFFDDQKEFSYKANFRIAESYFGGAKLDEAIKYFSLASLNSKNENEYYDAQIQLIKCNILRGTISNSFAIIEKLNNDSKFINKKDELIYWRGWSFIFNDEWKKASLEFRKIENENEGAKFLAEFTDSVSNEKYSKTKAKILSFILPGAGQIYAGKYLQGLISFSWNAAMAYLSANSFINEREFDGIVFASLFLRFHRGNLQNAEKIVDEKNQNIRNESLNYLQNNYGFEKP